MPVEIAPFAGSLPLIGVALSTVSLESLAPLPLFLHANTHQFVWLRHCLLGNFPGGLAPLGSTESFYYSF